MQKIQELLLQQCPQWASLSITPVATDGTDHDLFHLGDDLCIRVPRKEDVQQQLLFEHRWLPMLAPALPLAIPEPLFLGEPSQDYPCHWAIYRWLPGRDASKEPLKDVHHVAETMAQFICALRAQPTEGVPATRRGAPLATQDVALREAVNALGDQIDRDAVMAIWHDALHALAWDKEPVWLHGDLLPANILLKDGRLHAVIDFGLAGVGDPACDLLPAWSLFGPDARQRFLSLCAVDDAMIRRARGWALSIALIIIPYYQKTNPGITAVA